MAGGVTAPDAPTPESVLAALSARPGAVLKRTWGETTAFHNPGGRLPHGTYFATVKERDGPNDRASALDRPGVWRLNLGLPPALFTEAFGPPPARPPKGGRIDGPWDFEALDTPTPHPIYGWMGWVAVLSPSAATLEAIAPWIDAAHAKARAAFERRLGREGRA